MLTALPLRDGLKRCIAPPKMVRRNLCPGRAQVGQLGSRGYRKAAFTPLRHAQIEPVLEPKAIRSRLPGCTEGLHDCRLSRRGRQYHQMHDRSEVIGQMLAELDCHGDRGWPGQLHGDRRFPLRCEIGPIVSPPPRRQARVAPLSPRQGSSHQLERSEHHALSGTAAWACRWHVPSRGVGRNGRPPPDRAMETCFG
jgi:hypothetical protein